MENYGVIPQRVNAYSEFTEFKKTAINPAQYHKTIMNMTNYVNNETNIPYFKKQNMTPLPEFEGLDNNIRYLTDKVGKKDDLMKKIDENYKSIMNQNNDPLHLYQTML